MASRVQARVSGDASSGGRKVYGVRALLAIRSRVFLEMLYGFSPIGAASNPASAVVTGKEVSSAGFSSQRKGSKPSIGPEGVQKKRRSSVTAETIHKIAQIPKMMQSSEKKRKESIKLLPRILQSLQIQVGEDRLLPLVFTRNQRSHFKISIRIMVWMGSKNRQESFKRWQSESIYANAWMEKELT